MRVSALLRYPVKSMMGEAITAVDVAADGVTGDRRLTALPPPDAHLAREWPDVPGLAPPEAIVSAGTVTPMAAAAPDTFFDYAPVHIVTTSTLEALRAGGPKTGFDARRFRPNLILDTPDEGFVENTWAGRRLTIGTARVEVLTPTPRCAVPALAHGDQPADPDVLRTVVARNRIDIGRGWFACVWMKRTPRPRRRSYSACASSTANDVNGIPSSARPCLKSE